MTTQRPPRSFLCLSCAAAATASSLQTSKHSTAGRWLQNAQHQDGQTQHQHILGGAEPRQLTKTKSTIGSLRCHRAAGAAGPTGTVLESCSR